MTKNDIFLLESESLSVQIAPAGSRYTRCRFERGGQVLQVKRKGAPDGEAVFCGRDTRGPGETCGGFGLMNEFMPSDQGTYEKAPLHRGAFLKMGVGVLFRGTQEAYSQKTEYPVLQAAAVSEAFRADEYLVELVQPDFLGFAYRLRRRIGVFGNTLTVEYRLRNTGEKELRFREYAHNFYRLGRDGRSQGCTVEGSFPLTPDRPELFERAGSGLTVRPFSGVCASALFESEGAAAGPGTVTVTGGGLRVSEALNGPLARCFLWALPDVLCPEQIAAFSVRPGDTAGWSRKYIFQTA